MSPINKRVDLVIHEGRKSALLLTRETIRLRLDYSEYSARWSILRAGFPELPRYALENIIGYRDGVYCLIEDRLCGACQIGGLWRIDNSRECQAVVWRDDPQIVWRFI